MDRKIGNLVISGPVLGVIYVSKPAIGLAMTGQNDSEMNTQYA